MDTRTYFEPPEPPEPVRRWISDRLGHHCNVDTFLETLGDDAPEDVGNYHSARERARAKWYAGSPHRPLEVNHVSDSVRFFGGPWVGYERLPEAMEVHGHRSDGVDVVYAVPKFMHAYREAISAGDEKRCRKMARAVYAWMERREAIDLEYAHACGVDERRVP